MTSGDPEPRAPVSETDRKYKLPSQASQIMMVFATQMRLFSKSKIALIYIILALMIPVLAVAGVADAVTEMIFGSPASVAYLLALLPLFVIVIPAMISGSVLSSEFTNRSVYLLFTLPVSRTTFYIGKFLAALTFTIGVFAMAYGFATLFGETAYPNNILGSFIVCMASMFALTAMAYGLGPFFKKGSTRVVIALMAFMPYIVLMMLASMSAGTAESLSSLTTLPPFAGYSALFMIDAGLGGFLGEIFQAVFLGSYHWSTYVIVSALWGALFLALGCIKMNRKEV
jgi:ABC-type transport system involved in multi-copper enzyme maturation permease subunit